MLEMQKFVLPFTLTLFIAVSNMKSHFHIINFRKIQRGYWKRAHMCMFNGILLGRSVDLLVVGQCAS